LAEPEAFSRRGFVDRRARLQHARLLMDSFGIQAPSPDTSMRLLSGGNQQRVVLARELSSQPKVLVAAQPTRGLDVGAIEYMTARLQETAANGVGVLLISTELEEILALSHRICVIHGGRVVGEMARRDADAVRLGLMLGGRAA
jgi:simple sugar transport system ATP-binding protein